MRCALNTTHQVHDVEKLVDSLVILDEGKILANLSMQQIAEKIVIQHEQNEPKSDTFLCCEKNISGYSVITENKDNSETNIDLELFFNMMISRNEKVISLFSGEKK